MARGTIDPDQSFLPTLARTPRIETVSGDTPATTLASVAIGRGAPAIPLGDAARVPRTSGAPPAASATQVLSQLAGLTLLDPSGAALPGDEEDSEGQEESVAGSGTDAPSLFEAIDSASGASLAGRAKA